MLDRLQGAKKFTKLDCKDAYNRAFIDKALGEFLDITCVVYLDDILIFSKDELDHE
ncbi:hypothetical protein LPUS_07036 [Lasallia pustulata]|uniref:Uncharacterized protein n=1 Tax=Lasallia pustulata TaxID=136370 RepID=A0A1W5D2Z7_9LECA|nr:hypothetical protein LPUS_07036 [Lasallia pustulata]